MRYKDFGASKSLLYPFIREKAIVYVEPTSNDLSRQLQFTQKEIRSHIGASTQEIGLLLLLDWESDENIHKHSLTSKTCLIERTLISTLKRDRIRIGHAFILSLDIHPKRTLEEMLPSERFDYLGFDRHFLSKVELDESWKRLTERLQLLDFESKEAEILIDKFKSNLISGLEKKPAFHNETQLCTGSKDWNEFIARYSAELDRVLSNPEQLSLFDPYELYVSLLKPSFAFYRDSFLETFTFLKLQLKNFGTPAQPLDSVKVILASSILAAGDHILNRIQKDKAAGDLIIEVDNFKLGRLFIEQIKVFDHIVAQLNANDIKEKPYSVKLFEPVTLPDISEMPSPDNLPFIKKTLSLLFRSTELNEFKDRLQKIGDYIGEYQKKLMGEANSYSLNIEHARKKKIREDKLNFEELQLMKSDIGGRLEQAQLKLHQISFPRDYHDEWESSKNEFEKSFSFYAQKKPRTQLALIALILLVVFSFSLIAIEALQNPSFQILALSSIVSILFMSAFGGILYWMKKPALNFIEEINREFSTTIKSLNGDYYAQKEYALASLEIETLKNNYKRISEVVERISMKLRQNDYFLNQVDELKNSVNKMLDILQFQSNPEEDELNHLPKSVAPLLDLPITHQPWVFISDENKSNTVNMSFRQSGQEGFSNQMSSLISVISIEDDPLIK